MKKLINVSAIFACALVGFLFYQGNTQAAPKSKTIVGVVNINEATAGELQLLPGIGPSKAKAIIQYRLKRTFKTSRNLIMVKGIGKKIYEKVHAHIVVKGPTTLKKPKN